MIQKLFAELFHSEPIIVRSPGRINLIGEHTDYSEGFVLPAAIDKYVQVAASKREDGLICLYAVQYNEHCVVNAEDIKPVKGSWTNYVLGVVDRLIERGHPISGFNMVIDGDIPAGAGLSSSAAMECAVCLTLSELFNLKLSRLSITLISQAAEHHFAGVKCGVMDQFASVYGKKDHVIKLDCRSLKYDYLPLKLEGYCITLFDTGVRHSLATTSAYNTRREECEAGLGMIKKQAPAIHSLRDVTMPQLNDITDPVIRKRCEYVVKENARLHAACEDLKIGDIRSFGQKMFQTHEGLSKDYEVSCPELDYLVYAVTRNSQVLGARMMGAGFGGCTINIIREDALEVIIYHLRRSYEKAMGKKLSVYLVQTANGTELLTQKMLA